MLRDGDAARLHLRRRPDRRRHRRGRRGQGLGPLPRLVGLGLLDQGALRRDRRRARTSSSTRRSRSGRAPRTTPSRSCSTPRGSRRTSAGSRRRRSTRASPRRSPTTASTASSETYHPPQGRRVSRDRATSRGAARSSSAAPASSARTSSARCSSAAPREVLVVDNLLSAERENLPDDERVDLVEALDHRRRGAGRAARGPRPTSSTSRPTTATRARWPTRSPTTRTTR